MKVTFQRLAVLTFFLMLISHYSNSDDLKDIEESYSSQVTSSLPAQAIPLENNFPMDSNQPVLPEEPTTDMIDESTDTTAVETGVINSFHGSPERLAELEKNYLGLQEKIAQLEKKYAQLTIGAGSVSVKTSPNSKLYNKAEKYVAVVKNYFGNQLFIAMVAAVIVFLLIILIYLITSYSKSRYSGTQKDFSEDMEIDNETDNRSKPMIKRNNDSDEHLDNTTKLNLARAYVEMGNQDKATDILHEVLAYGNDLEQEEAKVMLDNIRNANF